MDIWREWTEGDKWEQLTQIVRNRLSYQRFEHTKRVVEVAIKLANHYNQNQSVAMLAALFHDYAKELPKEQLKQILIDNGRRDVIELAPAIWHAPVGAYLVKQEFPFGEVIFESVCYHTTGRRNMTEMEKITFLADYTEPKRNFPGLEEIRKATWENLDEGMYLALNLNLEKLIKNHFLIAEVTIEARNDFLIKRSVK